MKDFEKHINELWEKIYNFETKMLKEKELEEGNGETKIFIYNYCR